MPNNTLAKLAFSDLYESLKPGPQNAQADDVPALDRMIVKLTFWEVKERFLQFFGSKEESESEQLALMEDDEDPELPRLLSMVTSETHSFGHHTGVLCVNTGPKVVLKLKPSSQPFCFHFTKYGYSTPKAKTWAAPYHANTALNLGFSMKHRAMQLAQRSRREKWYVIIYPTHFSHALNNTSAQRRALRHNVKFSEMKHIDGDIYCSYINDLFRNFFLIAQNVEMV